MAQIEKNVKQAETKAMDALERVQSMTEILSKNKGDVDEMIQGITEAMETSKKNLADIQELEQVCRKINKIVDAIGNVAIQTSMLAVNGAVEAARAGEYGKGFAVVSTDIQNLANDSSDNAEQIKDLVKGIQDQLLVVATDLKDISDSSVEEVSKAQKSAENLVAIERDMAGILQGNQAIRDAGTEIATGIAQILKGMEQIAAGAEEASKASEQAATAAKQQSEGTESLAAAIEEIASIADDLQSG